MRPVLHALAPPLLRGLVARVCGGHAEPIWEGVFRSFRDVPARGAAFAGEAWVDTARAHAAELLETLRRTGTIPGAEVEGHDLLPVLAALVQRAGHTVTVLDFGGGLGFGYLHLLAGLTSRDGLDYWIVETPRLCEAGRALFADDSRVHFGESLPEGSPRPDIVYVNSALQYVEDWKGLLAALCASGPQYCLLARLAAGNVPTFATAQRNHPGTVIPYWFLNEAELVDVMAGAGYLLLSRGVLARVYDQDNLPPGYRLGRMCNLLFARA